VPEKRTQLDVICEDGPVLAVNKQSGMISQGAPAGTLGLIDVVKDYIREKYNKPGNVYLGITHRLDRPVSGVMLFSRNSKCAARLSDQFAKRTVKKVYLAALEKPPEQPEGDLRDWLYRVPDHSQVRVVSERHKEAKLAHLTYRTLAVHRGRTLVEVTLGTGRMHQIRIQFGSRGCPIIGDIQYGSTRSIGGFTTANRDEPTIALHAHSLTIQHPVRKTPMTITASLPMKWQRLGLNWDTNSTTAPPE